MSKRWTFDEDLFLAAYFDAVGDHIGVHDLGRPSGAAAKRVEKLKACGAWEILQLHRDTRLAYRIALGLPVEVDDDELDRVERSVKVIMAASDEEAAA